MSHLRSSLPALILRRLFASVGADYNYFRQQITLTQRHLEKQLRRIAEPISIDWWSKPAIFDMDNKLQKYLNYSGGFFIEVGANNGFDQSNTYYLEKMKQWRGLLIEAIPKLYEQCVKERPQSQVVNYALVAPDYPEKCVKMRHVGLMSMVSEVNPEREDRAIQDGQILEWGLNCYQIDVPARTLTSILEEYGVTDIDFFSLDVEGFELQVLKGLDLTRYCPKYLLVETNDKAPIDDYLKEYYQEIDQLTFHDYLYRRR
ncbi:MAG: FkbM family methyltransferase [Microcystaceae cyanobacterium]